MSHPRPFTSAFAAGAVSPCDIIEFHRTHFGTARMEGQPAEQQPARPDGVSDAEWDALGDPGKRAIVRERERATKAESELAAARAIARTVPTPPAPVTPPPPAPAPPAPPPAADSTSATDLAALVAQAVAAAIKPLEERDQQRDATQAANVVVNALTEAAKVRLRDHRDALANIDLTTLVNESGQPDDTKIAGALDGLVHARPHLAKVVDDRRRADPNAPLGGASPALSMDDRVKATLAKMQASSGVKIAGA